MHRVWQHWSSLSHFKNSNKNNENSWSKIVINGEKKSKQQINLLNAVGKEQKERKQKERSVIVFGLPVPVATSNEEKKKEDLKNVGELLDSLDLNNFSQMIEQIHRFSAPVGSNKIAPIRVTIKENTDFFANQIANAAKKKR